LPGDGNPWVFGKKYAVSAVKEKTTYDTRNIKKNIWRTSDTARMNIGMQPVILSGIT
jgi:hypothetical protein